MAKPNPDTLLLKALGRLPNEQKLLFIHRAKQTLSSTSEAHRTRRWSPSDQNHATLGDLHDKCRALALAMERTSNSGIPEWYLREAWSIAASIQETGEAFPERLHMTLRTLALAARIWLPDAKPNHRPAESSISHFVVRFLASDFHGAIGKPPSLGTGSPFVKFCIVALPQYGFDVPSLPTIKRILTEAK